MSKETGEALKERAESSFEIPPFKNELSPFKNVLSPFKNILSEAKAQNGSLSDDADFQSPKGDPAKRKTRNTDGKFGIVNKSSKNANKSTKRINKGSKNGAKIKKRFSSAGPKQNLLSEMLKEKFGDGDTDVEQMQMALALSMSLEDASSQGKSDSENDSTLPGKSVRKTLEQYGFSSRTSVLPVQNKRPSIARSAEVSF